MTVGERIAERRKELKMSQRALAKAAGVSQPTISAIESGTKAPSTVTVQLIAHALRTTVSALMGESPQSPTPPADEAHQLYESLSDQDKEKALEYMRFILSQRKKG